AAALELAVGQLAMLDELFTQGVELMVAELFGLNEAIVCFLDREDQLIEFGLHRLAVAILAVLQDEDHEEGNDRRRGIDNELPGLREAKERPGDGPRRNQCHGERESHGTAGKIGDQVRETRE